MSSDEIDFWIKKNDTAPALKVALKDDDDNPIDISGSSVDFHMRQKNSATAKVSDSAIIANASGGEVKYEWADGDTDQTGKFEAEFEVTYSDGSVETFPNTSNLIVKVVDEID